MATLSKERNVKVLAEVEATYNTSPTLAGGTDDVTVVDSPNPVTPNFGVVSQRPHSDSFTYTTKDQITTQLWNVALQFMMQGSTSRTGNTVNGFKGLSALLQSSGMTETVGADIVFTPSAMSALKSAYCTVDTDGILHTIGGMVGNTIFRGSPETAGVICSYTGAGMYTAPTLATTSGYVGPDRAQPFRSITGGIKPSGGTLYNPAAGLCFDSFEFNRGFSNANVICAGASTGIAKIEGNDAMPTLQLIMALEKSATAGVLDYTDLYSDLTSRVDHWVQFQYGSGTNIVQFDFPTAQLLNIVPGVKNGYRIVTCTYKIRHATANSEFSITCGSPALTIS